MADPTCPKCRRVIPPQDTHVGHDVAWCRACNLTSSLSRLTRAAELADGVDLAKPTTGAWQYTHGPGVVIGAMHRAIAATVNLMVHGLFLLGFTAVFLLVALTPTLCRLGVALPAWMPKPDADTAAMGWAMLIFLWIVAGALSVWSLRTLWSLLVALAGKTETSLGRSEAWIFTGIGPFGRRRRFDPERVADVRIEREDGGEGPDKIRIVILFRDGTRLRFGVTIAQRRRQFVAACLHKRLVLPG